MRTTATLRLELSGVQTRKSLGAVLAPDNVGLPRGLELTSKGSGSALVYSVEAESPSTAVSTTLALLRDAALFQEVWLLSRGKAGAAHRGKQN